MAQHGNGNVSVVLWREFVLEGFRGGVETQALLFAVFLALYVVTIMGNLTMISVITLDARLHSPMYFFLKNLSFLDLCYSSVFAPEALTNFLSSSKVISFGGCATQLFFFSFLGTTEAFLLAVMAYDRFMAIFNPLHYPVTMSPTVCAGLVLASYCGGWLNPIIDPSLTFQLPFCSSNRINHFFCDVQPLLQLACADTALNELVMFVICGCITVSPTVIVLMSYCYIAVTVLKMRSGSRGQKVFSTCGSHLTAVTLFYGTLIVIYAQPGGVESMEQGKFLSIFYTLVIPMLNPLIYSLQNKDVKDDLRRLGQRRGAPYTGGLERDSPGVVGVEGRALHITLPVTTTAFVCPEPFFFSCIFSFFHPSFHPASLLPETVISQALPKVSQPILSTTEIMVQRCSKAPLGDALSR
ncbi:Olfactory receptor 12 [Heterocephalus glaber]|uniref:Olfactory receptor 12 n=1 Tax=Heterocephalus glaber TaxID=10181 RepID=G5C3P2_HETGA|nr:Olfactory receptor 12 [Heterocephalus glaber]